MSDDGIERVVALSGAVFTREPGKRHWKRNGKGRWANLDGLWVEKGRPSREEADELTSRLGRGPVAMIHPRSRT
jgi:hypothetical protein